MCASNYLGFPIPRAAPSQTSNDYYTTHLREWRRNLPLVYDMFIHQSLEWPAYACCWGKILDSTRTIRTQRLYMSRSTDASVSASGEWYGHPNTIEVCSIDIPTSRAMDDRKLSQFSEDSKSSNVHVRKRIIHPGEVNRIKVCHQHADIIATHSDSSDVFVWNTHHQPNRYSRIGSAPNDPDLVLKGHDAASTFALDFSATGPLVISGGEDSKVCLWSLDDGVSSLADTSNPGYGSKSVSRSLDARVVFAGHQASVEDCVFHPTNPFTFASVGDDCRLIVWDSRAGPTPSSVLDSLHATDINCISWNMINHNLLLTGSSDHLTKIVDIRQLGSPNAATISQFDGHTKAVTTAQWSPFDANVFLTSSEDSKSFVVDISRLNDAQDLPFESGIVPGVIMSHVGHRSPVVYLDWNPCDQWTIASISDESAVQVGGGTLQIWRLSDLVTIPIEDLAAELESVAA